MTSPNVTLAARSGRWTQAVALLVVLIAAIIIALWGTAVSMVNVWAHSATFNHGFLIPLISGGLVWMKRGELRHVVPRANLFGLLGMAGAALLWLSGQLASVQVVQHFALVFMIQFAVLAVWGWPAVRLIIFPLAYLLFAAPFGEFLTGHLQDFTAGFVVHALRLFGIPVYSDGVFISIPNGNFEVAEACAGLRFLIATVAVGTLFAYLSYKGMVRRLIFIALALVVPVIANGFRALGIILIAHFSDNKYAHGVDHIIYGWGFFAFVLLLLIYIGSRFTDKPVGIDLSAIPADGAERPSGSFTLATYAAVGLVLAAAGPAYAQYIALQGENALIRPDLPQQDGAWHALAADANPLGWAPKFIGVSHTLERAYTDDTGQVAQIYVGVYDSQHQGAELINDKNDLTAGPMGWKRSDSGQRNIPDIGQTGIVRVTNLKDSATVYYWYWVDDRLVVSDLKAKFLYTKSALLNGNPVSGVIAVIVPDALTEERTDEILRSVTSGMRPLTARFVPSGAGAP